MAVLGTSQRLSVVNYLEALFPGLLGCGYQMTSPQCDDYIASLGQPDRQTCILGGGGSKCHGDNVKVRKVIKRIEADGWFWVRTTGDHRQFHHPSKPDTVTVAGKLNDEMPPGTLNIVLKQAGLKGGSS